jgi:hypothetical protein
MGMKKTLDVINAMVADGIIERYAIAGAVAAYNYIDPTITEDIDILISLDAPSSQRKTGLVVLSPILSYLKSKGYGDYRKEGLLIEGWPVQFLPVANDLDAEALDRAQEVEIKINESEGTVKTRVLRPEHLIATALRVGRPKDFVRITQFLDENAVNNQRLCEVLNRHGLIETWQLFCRRTGVNDPCEVEVRR